VLSILEADPVDRELANALDEMKAEVLEAVRTHLLEKWTTKGRKLSATHRAAISRALKARGSKNSSEADKWRGKVNPRKSVSSKVRGLRKAKAEGGPATGKSANGQVITKGAKVRAGNYVAQVTRVNKDGTVKVGVGGQTLSSSTKASNLTKLKGNSLDQARRKRSGG